MIISVEGPSKDAIRVLTIAWLTRVLSNNELQGVEKPHALHGYIYIDGTPRVLYGGAWQLNTDAIYLANISRNALDPFTKLGILAAVGHVGNAMDDPGVIEKFSGQLARILREGVATVYGNIVRSTRNVSRLAVDKDGCRIAAEMNGGWFLPNGLPVEVNDTWITMGF